MRVRTTVVVVGCAAFLVSLTAFVYAQQPKAASAGQAAIWNATQGEWTPLPDVFPPGAEMKVVHGNPATGPADFYMRFPSGYQMPWHFHTPIEKVLMDQGELEFDVRGGQHATIGKGGYIDIPSRLPHKAVCTSSDDCLIYLVSNDVFDIFVVNDDWNVVKSWTAGETSRTSSR